MNDWSQFLDASLKLGLAALIGSALGFERDLKGKPAGVRTNALICLGAALVMMLSVDLARVIGQKYGEGVGKLVGDPARLAAQVVSGIGFLGAGAILQSKNGKGLVFGMTTAATIWVNAAIGLAIGAGFYVLAATAAFISLTVLLTVTAIRNRFQADTPRERILVLVLKKEKEIAALKKDIYRKGIQLEAEKITRRVDEIEYRAELNLSARREEELVHRFSEDKNVLSLYFTKDIGGL